MGIIRLGALGLSAFFVAPVAGGVKAQAQEAKFRQVAAWSIIANYDRGATAAGSSTDRKARWRRTMGLVAAVLVTSGGMAAQAQQTPQGAAYADLGPWKIESFPASAQRGALPYCQAEKIFGSENVLRFQFDGRTLAIEYMGLASAALGSGYPVRFWIDNPASAQPANVRMVEDDTWARIEMPHDGAPGTDAALAMAKRLTVKHASAPNVWTYTLEGADAAYRGMFACQRTLAGGQQVAQRPSAPPPPPPPPPAAQRAPRFADCLLTVKGRAYIDGRCRFESDPDGSFRLFGGPYFTYVNVFQPGLAGASWNADPASTRAQAPLGDVKRDGACWVNRDVRICAWKPGERPAVVVAAPPPVACPTPGTIRASDSKQPATVRFRNRTNVPLAINWLDYKGQRKFYRTLSPGEEYRQPTYVAHPWIAIDNKGRCHGKVYWPQPGESVADIVD